ncbi:hypothetical protein D3C75_224340 [compost metagenome]
MSNKKVGLTTFVRKQLKVKGSTEHWGRGFYVCEADVSNEQLYEKVKAILPTWEAKGMVLDKQVDEQAKRVNVLFAKQFSSDHYRILNVGVDFPFGQGYMVSFCMEDTTKL